MANETKTKVDDPAATRLLFDALKQKSRGQTALVKLTPADAVALTGMPSAQAEPALKSLVKTYRSHLAVTEEGELVYEFDPSLERRDKVPLRERLAAAGQVAWKGFQFLFKIWIVVTLVVYVVAFIAMMISLMFAKSSDDRDDRRGGGGGMPWLWFWLMPDLAPPGYHRDRYGRPVQKSDKPKKRFYQSVFDFVFGPKTAPVDPRESDKRLLAYLRDHKGRVTAAELTALTGISLAASEEELTRLMVEYDGEVEVAGDGTLLYVFEGVLPSATSAGTWWTYAWDKADPVPPLTGNTGGTDAVIAGFSGFNLLASFTIGPAFLQRIHLTGDPTATFLVTLFPLMFSAIFFAVPAARWVVRQRALSKRERRQLRRELLREIWAQPAEGRESGGAGGEGGAALGAAARDGAQDAGRAGPRPRRRRDDRRKGRHALRVPAARRGAEGGRGGAGGGAHKQLGAVIFSSEDAEDGARG